MLAAVVDTEALLDVIVASLAAGLLVTAAFSLAIMGAVRFADHRRENRMVQAGAFLLLVGVAVAVCLGSVAFGIVVMTTKD